MYHRPIFAQYASACWNAEALCATTLQLPVHPGMSEAALDWVADRIRPAQAALREVEEKTGIRAEVIGDPLLAHPAVTVHAPPYAILEMQVYDSKVGRHRHIDFLYVLHALSGVLTAQVGEVGGAQWAPHCRCPGHGHTSRASRAHHRCCHLGQGPPITRSGCP